MTGDRDVSFRCGPGRTTDGRRSRLAWAPARRRGVVGILAMMFLVMFASLAAAMAVSTQGNLRSAASHLRVVRSLGAVDSGMLIARHRLSEATARFLVTQGEVDTAAIENLWSGTAPVPALPAPFGMPEDSPPANIMAALANIHLADASANLVEGADPANAPQAITVLPGDADTLVTLPIGLARNSAGRIVSACQITYDAPDAEGRVTVTVNGYDWDTLRETWVRRRASQSFALAKRVEFAVLSNTPPLLGAGGSLDGPLGSRFNSTSLDPSGSRLDGSPFVAISDFYGLDSALNAKLDDFYDAVLAHDVDGDNRLRVNHAAESVPLGTLNSNNYNATPGPDNAFQDKTLDDAIDDYDIFLEHYDTDGDGNVVLSTSLTDGTPSETRTPEFTANDRLAYLIDTNVPDRNGNGVRNGDFVDGAWDFSTFGEDVNGDGLIDIDDVDPDDVVLGYRDGQLNGADMYAKVRGTVYLSASRASWEASTDEFGQPVGNYQSVAQGPVSNESGEDPIVFEAPSDQLPELDQASFQAAAASMNAAVDLLELEGSVETFEQQVAAQMGADWTPPTKIEPTPFGATSAADWYARPIYDGLVFENVTIPMGLNALFVNCEFIGVTRVEAWPDNTHVSWLYYGATENNGGTLEQIYPPPPAESDEMLDRSYAIDVDPDDPDYLKLPEPLVVPVDLDGDGTAYDTCYDTKKLSNNVRFHSCLFVGSITTAAPAQYSGSEVAPIAFTHVRNKFQFTGSTRFLDEHPTDGTLEPHPDTVDEIERSTMLAPQVSVDIGSMNPPPTQDVRMQGAIIAGVLDIRGNATIHGVVLSTFEPVRGEMPMIHFGDPVGNPANFNVSIGYVTRQNGDLEAVDPTELGTLIDLDGDGEVDLGWDSARGADGLLVETAGWDGVHLELWYDGVPDDDADPAQHVRRVVPYTGLGVTRIEADPDAVLPDGLALPLTVEAVRYTYREQ